MQSLMSDSSRFCYYCGFENPQDYKLCGNCRGENPVKISGVIQSPQEVFAPLVVNIPKSRGTYIILGLLFGWFGLHNIYAKRNNVGAVQLIFFLMFFWTLIVPFILVLWSLVEILTVKNDGNGIPMS
jgi:TM2 domain-containing membrane protein YozV